MAYAKECGPAGMELVPYDGDNPYKQGTATCAGCGVRCSRDTGLPTEGNVCSLVAGSDTQSLESQRAAVGKAIEAAVAEANEKLVADHAAEVAELKKQLAEAKAPPSAPVQAPKAAEAPKP